MCASVRRIGQAKPVGQAVTAERQRRSQVRDDLAQVMHRARRPPPAA